jgi:hypothetical protein
MRRTKPTPAEKAEELARAQAVLEWRRTDLREIEAAMVDAARPASVLVPAVWTGFGVEKRRSQSQINDLWTKIVDPVVAAHCRPAGLVRGTLFVDVDSNAWLSEIVRYRRVEILERVQLAVGKTLVQKISFRVG